MSSRFYQRQWATVRTLEDWDLGKGMRGGGGGGGGGEKERDSVAMEGSYVVLS